MNTNDINTPPLKPPPPKLGGWLLIIYILLFLAWLKVIQSFIEYASFLNESPTEVRGMVVFNIILSAVYFVFILYLLVIMAMKKRFFLKSMMVFLIFTIVINVISYFLFKSLSADINRFLMQRMIAMFIACAASMAYFLNSERVRTTFIL
jgi:hypothetical protein